MYEPVTYYEIPEGAEGTRATLEMMRQLAREAANGSCSGMNVLCTEIMEIAGHRYRALNFLDDFCRSKYQFVPDPVDVEQIKNPAVMIAELESFDSMQGDCDDISTFIASALVCMHVPARFVAIKGERDNPEFTHVYTEADCGFYWKRFDPTVVRNTIYRDHGKMILNV